MIKKILRCLSLLLFVPALTWPAENREFSLQDLINLGLENNPLLSAQRSNIEAKKAAYKTSKRLMNPEFTYQRGEAKSWDQTVHRNTERLSISQQLENPFKRHYRIQWYEKDLTASEFSYESLSLEIKYEIKSHFYKILLLAKQKELAQKNLNSIQKIYRLIEKRVTLGEVKELEAIKLYVETLKAQNKLNHVQTDLILAKENLNKFLGNTLPPEYSLRGTLTYTRLQLEESTLLDKTLLSHPKIKEQETRVTQAKSQLYFIKWKRLPDFKLSGFSHKALDGKNLGIGISMDIPLWNFRSQEIREAENLYRREGEQLKAFKMEMSTEIKSTFSQLRLSEQNLQIFHEGLLKQARESLKISEISYTEGEISLIDYLDSRRTYYSILKDYQESLFKWNADKAALEKAMGEELK